MLTDDEIIDDIRRALAAATAGIDPRPGLLGRVGYQELDATPSDPWLANRPRRRERRTRLRSLPGIVAVLLGVAVVIVVGVIALRPHARCKTPAAAIRQGDLVSMLSVLRRPQTTADDLPRGLRIASPLSPPGGSSIALRAWFGCCPTRVYTSWSPDGAPTRSGAQSSATRYLSSRSAVAMPPARCPSPRPTSPMPTRSAT